MTPTQPDVFIDFLKSLSGKHVAFFPKSGNAGDGFIAHATYALFEKYNISYTSYSQDEVVEDEIVLIGGGGNLIEGKYEDVARIIWQHRSNAKVVLLPHTIVGYAEIIAETNNNLQIFCREPVSYELALLNGAKKEKTHLAHDITFYLEDNYFAEFVRKGKEILYALRTDGESSGAVPINKENIDISLSWNGDLWKDAQFCKHVTYSLASYISPFEKVLTDRLHVSILSAFLGKNVSLMPNDYYKNRAIYEHSLKNRFPNVNFINTASNITDFEINSHEDAGSQLINSENDIDQLKDEIIHLKEINSDLQNNLANQMAVREEVERRFQIKLDDWEEQYELAEKKFSIREANLRQELENYLNKSGENLNITHLPSAESSNEKYISMLAESNSRLNEIFNSTTWKFVSKINKIGTKLPVFIRKAVRWTFR